VTADPRTPVQQIPPVAADGARPSDGGNHSAQARVALPPQKVERKPISLAEIWLRRIAVLLFVILCAAMGVLLVILPWSLQWTDNRLLWGYPELRTFLATGFVRGLCSGLGILDLWIGFREAAHYHEEPRTAK
jgi:hypothetical protein